MTAVKIWRVDWAGWADTSNGGGEGRGWQVKRASLFLSVYLFSQQYVYPLVPALRLSLQPPVCQAAVAVDTVTLTCVTFRRHIPAVISLSEWRLVLSDISMTHAHIYSHVWALCSLEQRTAHIKWNMPPHTTGIQCCFSITTIWSEQEHVPTIAAAKPKHLLVKIQKLHYWIL